MTDPRGLDLEPFEFNQPDKFVIDDSMLILPLRSNIPAISQHAFGVVDETFPARAKASDGGILVGGENYGQGSSRKHAALAPRYLGIRAVLVKSFARIHLANLINFGILPLVFVDPADYDRISQGDRISLTLADETAGCAISLRDLSRLGRGRVREAKGEGPSGMVFQGASFRRRFFP